ncbi:MAG: DEAD/DEAH box helicase [Desulfurococcales archaeon]|nr:DEAD/DEAH box helicase [Desulfurococcales archaeon]
MAVPGTKRRLGWDALVYAYQHVVLADLAAMRGLIPSLVTLAPAPTRNRLIVARPHRRTGLQDPEQRLSLAEVLQAIRRGIERYHEDRGRVTRASPEEIAEAFIELLRMGYIVIHYPQQDREASRDAGQSSDGVIREAARLVNEYIRSNVDSDLDIAGFNFKSYHGELARLAANASPLPSRYEAVGFLALPAVLEPLPSGAQTPGLPGEARRWLRSQCPNKDEGEALLSALEDALERAGYQRLNTYQYQVISEYFKRRKQGGNPLDAVLTAPTGAGKTLAFTVIALLEILAAKCRGEKTRVVLTYPRKTLARDQVEDIARILAFLNDNIEKRGLPPRYTVFLWLRDGSSGVEKCPPDGSDCVELPRKPEPIRGITIPAREGSPYATHYYDNRARAYKSQPRWLIDVKDDVIIEIPGGPSGSPLRVKPGDVADIVVTNYDMLFKESLDILRGTPTPLGRILREAGIVVLDEAHMVMGGNQSIMVQTYALALDVAGRRPGIILSSATLLERRLLDPRASPLNVVALEVRQGPSRSEALEAFRGLLGLEPSRDTVYIDYYDTASRGPGGWKLTLWTIIYPSLLKKPMTALNEAIVSVLHTLAAARARWDNGAQAKAIVFIEYKSSLRDVASELTERITLESGDVYDRVLLTRLFDEHYSKLRRLVEKLRPNSASLQLPQGDRREAYGEIADGTRKLAAQKGIKDIAGILWSEYFERFHALAPYASIEDHAFILRCRVGTVRPSRRLEEAVKHIVSKANRALPPPPLSCDVWMEHMLLHAALARNHRPWESGQALEDYYREVSALGGALGLDLTRFIPVVTHHGDYIGAHRHLADRLLEEANPLVILATSTLEVGLNIPGIVATIHYILPREPGRILQMVGRSGRRPETMRVSHGVVILRQNAWESSKRVEVHAFRYFNEIASPPTPSLKGDPYYLARLCITMNQTRCTMFHGHVDRSVGDVADYIVRKRFDIIGETTRAARAMSALVTVGSWCSPSLKKKIDSAKRSLGAQYRELSSALDAMHKACSGTNHAVILAAAENAYTLILDALVSGSLQASAQRRLEDLLREISKLRASIYSHIARSIAQALGGQYDLDEIVSRLVYPRGFEVPGAGDLESLAGRVILVG